MAREQGQRQTVATLIALLVVTEIILHFCWKALDAYLFANFTVTTQIVIVAVILLLFVLFFREELVLGLVGGGSGGGSRNRKNKGGGVRNVRRDKRK